MTFSPPSSDLPKSLGRPRRQNPFGPRPGEPPSYLAGRQSQIDEWARPVRQLLESARTSGPVFFTAPRGLGKTVLLREMERDASAAGFVVAWATASASESLIGTLLGSVKSAVRQRLRDDAADLISRLDSVTVSAGVPGIFQVETSTRSTEQLELTVSREFASLARKLRNQGTRGLMLFVDELQAAPAEDLAVLVPALQEWTSGGVHTPLMLVASGPVQLSRILSAHGGFAERFKYIPLERLSDMDAMSAFTLGLSAEFTWLPGALDRAVAAAEGHPYMIQLIGHCAWEASAASAIAKPFFTTADIDLGAESARQEIKRVFEARWADTPDGERFVLAAVAESVDGRLTRREIARESGLATRDVESAVDSLYANGWLDVDGLERVRIALPGVAEFVLRRSE